MLAHFASNIGIDLLMRSLERPAFMWRTPSYLDRRAVLDADPGSEEARDRWVAAKRRSAEVEEEARARSFRVFATEKLNKPANIGRVHKILRQMEGADQAAPGQDLGDNGRAVEDRDKATVFVKTNANISLRN